MKDTCTSFYVDGYAEVHATEKEQGRLDMISPRGAPIRLESLYDAEMTIIEEGLSPCYPDEKNGTSAPQQWIWVQEYSKQVKLWKAEFTDIDGNSWKLQFTPKCSV